METVKASRVAVIGAGSSGQAIAAFLAVNGYEVSIWNRDDAAEVEQWMRPIAEAGGLQAEGLVEGFAPIERATTDIAEAIADADVILVNTTIDAYRSIGQQLAPRLSSSQVLILMSSGTLGSLDVLAGLADGGFTDELLLGQTSTTVFGSRSLGDGAVSVRGRKTGVEISSVPSGRADDLVALLPEFEFIALDDVLRSEFDTMGPALHAVPMVLNAGRVESGDSFLHYTEGITPSIAAAIDTFDQERIAIAEAFGCKATTVHDYLRNTVRAPDGTLYESINGCVMYQKTLSADQLDHRFLWEDTCGAVPLLALAEVANVPVPLTDAIVALSSALLGRAFRSEGRTGERLGLIGMSPDDVRALFYDADALSSWRTRLASATA